MRLCRLRGYTTDGSVFCFALKSCVLHAYPVACWPLAAVERFDLRIFRSSVSYSCCLAYRMQRGQRSAASEAKIRQQTALWPPLAGAPAARQEFCRAGARRRRAAPAGTGQGGARHAVAKQMSPRRLVAGGGARSEQHPLARHLATPRRLPASPPRHLRAELP